MGGPGSNVLNGWAMTAGVAAAMSGTASWSNVTSDFMAAINMAMAMDLPFPLGMGGIDQIKITHATFTQDYIDATTYGTSLSTYLYNTAMSVSIEFVAYW